tara:strand:- start:308 stop:520 length:213 start_codon:yes stop_codon:yes gene_type:complete
MCFGGGRSSPPPPEPVAPNPPKVDATTEQTEPAPSEEDNTVSNIKAKTKGTSLLTIPLTTTSGSGVQTGN